MKPQYKYLLLTIAYLCIGLGFLCSCSNVVYPDHDYYDRLVTGVTKKSYQVVDIYGRNCPKIHAENPDSTRVGQWLTLKDEFKNASR